MQDEWLQALYYVMDRTYAVGAHIYPFLFALNVIRIIASIV